MSIALPNEPLFERQPTLEGRQIGASGRDGVLSQGALRYERNAILYRSGEPRACLYYIEAGVVALLRQAPQGHREIVEFAFAGDVLGAGLFEHHTSWAQAASEVHARRMPLTALDELLRSDKRAFDRYAEGLQREFEYRRKQLVNAERSLTSRVAALLVALSRLNRLEGRDPRVVGDELEGAAVAAWLGVDVQALANALVELEQSGLIEQAPPAGVRLPELARLERLVDALPLPVGSGSSQQDRAG